MKICSWKKVRVKRVGEGWSLGRASIDAEVSGQPEIEVPPGVCYNGDGDSSFSGECSSFSGEVGSFSGFA